MPPRASKVRARPSFCSRWGLAWCSMLIAILLFVAYQISAHGDGRGGVKVYSYKIVGDYPHDGEAFTQGLLYYGNDTLYESTGLYGMVRVLLRLQQGRDFFVASSLQSVSFTFKLERPRESGSCKTEILEKAWPFGRTGNLDDSQAVHLRPKDTKAGRPSLFFLLISAANWCLLCMQLGKLEHPMEDGWGLTTDGKHVIGSDGSSKLYFMDPESFAEVRRVIVNDEGRRVRYLNELEYVKGEIWANVWQTECIARISPKDGHIVGWILLQGLRSTLVAAGYKHIDVLNGIAWDSARDRLFVTGKLWPKLFEIALEPVESTIDNRSIRATCII